MQAYSRVRRKHRSNLLEQPKEEEPANQQFPTGGIWAGFVQNNKGLQQLYGLRFVTWLGLYCPGLLVLLPGA